MVVKNTILANCSTHCDVALTLHPNVVLQLSQKYAVVCSDHVYDVLFLFLCEQVISSSWWGGRLAILQKQN